MNKIKFFLTILFAITFAQGFSQTDFRPGYYITLTGDTVKGLVDYRGEIRNSKFCVFKKDETSEESKFLANEIKAYRFTDSKYYVSKLVTTEKEETLIFLEYLVNGIDDLYYYRDENKDHYFIETAECRLVELTNDEKTVYIEGREGTVKSKKYLGQLKATFSNCPEVQKQIETTELTHKSLIKIVKSYHDYVCDGEKCIVYEKNVAKVNLNLIPVFGINSTRIDFENESVYKDYNFENKLSYAFGLLLNISLPRLNEKLSLQTGLIYTKHFYGTYYENGNYRSDFGLYAYYIKNPIAIRYIFPKYKIRPFANVGMYNTYVLRTNFQLLNAYLGSDEVNVTIKKTEDFSKLQVTFFAGAGLQYFINKRNSVFVEYRYEQGRNLLSGRIFCSSILMGVTF